MNARNILKNETLQRVGRLLLTRRRLSTREIRNGADVCAVNSIIAELNDPLNNWKIHCERDGKYFYYTVLKPGHGADLCRRAA
jgi:hypothetical protein